MANDVQETRQNNISNNISYCFVDGYVKPQKAPNNPPYHVWVILHKATGKINSSLCSCRAQLRGFCKHTIALLENIADAV
jgi:patatin-like phospholipase/acyl hydrolase